MKYKRTFSYAVIEGAYVPEGMERFELRDSKIPSLVCRISKSGIKSFSVYKRVNGSRPERITIGRFPQVSVSDARKIASKINGEIAVGKNPAQVKRSLKGELTFDELFLHFVQNHPNWSNSTRTNYHSIYTQYLKSPLGTMKLSHIAKSDIYNIFSAVTATKKTRKKSCVDKPYLTGARANTIATLAGTIFNWGIAMEFCNNNPAARIKKHREEGRSRFLHSDELPKFMAALEMEENEVVRDFILMCLLTGARRSNVASMKWQDVYLERGEWNIPHTKNGSPQTAILSKEALSLLTKRKDTRISDFVFQGDGKKGHIDDPKKAWNRLLKRAGIENLRLHDLRRTFGSWQAKTGSNLLVIGKSLGHKSLVSTAIYARLDLEDVRTSVETATRAIMRAARKSSCKGNFNSASQRRKIVLRTFGDLLGLQAA